MCYPSGAVAGASGGARVWSPSPLLLPLLVPFKHQIAAFVGSCVSCSSSCCHPTDRQRLFFFHYLLFSLPPSPSPNFPLHTLQHFIPGFFFTSSMQCSRRIITGKEIPFSWSEAIMLYYILDGFIYDGFLQKKISSYLLS